MPARTPEQILAVKTGHGKVTFADGSWVEVRSLTPNEEAEVAGLDTVAEKNVFIVHKAMVNPKMTIEQVQAWADGEGSTEEFVAVLEGIHIVSGHKQGAGKSGVAGPGD